MAYRRALPALLLCTTLLFTTGCNSLPGNSEPQALRKFESSQHEAAAMTPIAGREPDLLVRDFYVAAANPTSDYLSARNFLSPEAARRWNPRESTLIVNRIDLTTRPTSERDAHAYQIRGEVTGRLSPDGSYRPENFLYEADVELHQVGGEWRIDSLPDGIVLERAELRNQFQPYDLYFFDPTNRVLVGDRRWVFAHSDTLDTTLLSLWAQGPSRSIRPAVNVGLPAEAEFTGARDGVYHFSGLADLGPDQRLLLAASLVWTLSSARVQGPYALEADGQRLLDFAESYTTDDFAEFNPQAYVGSAPAVYALTDRNLYQVSNGSLDSKNNVFANVGDIRSAAMSSDGTGAVVRQEGERSRLWVGDLSQHMDHSVVAETLTTPTFEYDPSVIWVVADGRRVLRVVRSAASGELSESNVNIADLHDIDGDISVLRLSHDGTRAAFVIAGRLYTAVIQRLNAAERRLTNVVEIAPQLGDSVLSVDWQLDGSLVVGTSTPETPVWRVEQDGSAVTSLPSGNLTAPVVAVSASPSMLYVTDAHSSRQLPIGGNRGSFWREVPGLQGVRSALVVAN